MCVKILNIFLKKKKKVSNECMNIDPVVSKYYVQQSNVMVLKVNNGLKQVIYNFIKYVALIYLKT